MTSANSHSPIHPRPSLILFDLDDTLCDYATARMGRLRQAFSEALAQVPGGKVVDIDQVVAESIEIQPHGSDHFGMMLARYGAGQKEIVDQARSWFHKNRFLGLKLFPGAAELLEDLRRRDPAPRIGLVTNGPTEVQHAKIDLLHLRDKIDFAVISEEVGVAKPDPRIFRAALERGAADVPEAVFAGDSPELDIAGARAIGIRSIWMDHGRMVWPPGQPRPDWVAQSIAGLRALLLGT